MITEGSLIKLKHFNQQIVNKCKINYSRFHLKLKIDKLLKINKCSSLSTQEKIEIKTFYKKFGIKNINTSWHKFYKSVYGSHYVEYIPEDIFFSIIEPHLNRISDFKGLEDKNLHSKIFGEVKQPKTIIKNINGFFFNDKDTLIDLESAISICLQVNRFVIKPSLDSGSGKGVQLFNPPDTQLGSKRILIVKLLESYKKDFIVQELIESIEQLKLLNESSVNTVRVTTLLLENKVEILNSLLRVGEKGMFADNAGYGTYACQINPFGKINQGYDFSGRSKFPTYFGLKLEDIEVPKFKEIIDLATKLHSNLPYFRIISWDFTVNQLNEIILFEYNIKWQDINAHQINNGPLFGKFTDKILSELKGASK